MHNNHHLVFSPERRNLPTLINSPVSKKPQKSFSPKSPASPILKDSPVKKIYSEIFEAYDGPSSLSCKQIRAPDMDIIKFERVSIRLERLLDQVHAKYEFGKNLSWNSLSPRLKGTERRFSDDSEKNVFGGREFSVRESNEGKMSKPLNRLSIRSKLFKKTVKWIPDRPDC